jgi:prevent-host-death family protein
MEAISMAEARANLSEVVSRASSEGEKFVIHNRGNAKAVLMSIEEYRDIEATLEEMKDPEALRLLKKGNEDIAKERTRTVEEIFGEALF